MCTQMWHITSYRCSQNTPPSSQPCMHAFIPILSLSGQRSSSSWTAPSGGPGLFCLRRLSNLLYSWQLSTWQKLKDRLFHDVWAEKTTASKWPSVCVGRCGCCRRRRQCVSCFRSAVLLNYLSTFYSESPPPHPSSFHRSLRLTFVFPFMAEFVFHWNVFLGKWVGAKSTSEATVFSLIA